MQYTSNTGTPLRSRTVRPGTCRVSRRNSIVGARRDEATERSVEVRVRYNLAREECSIPPVWERGIPTRYPSRYHVSKDVAAALRSSFI